MRMFVGKGSCIGGAFIAERYFLRDMPKCNNLRFLVGTVEPVIDSFSVNKESIARRSVDSTLLEQELYSFRLNRKNIVVR